MGSVDEVGTFLALRREGAVNELVVDAHGALVGVRVGERLAVNGACLVVSRVVGARVFFRISDEVALHSSIADAAQGNPVNVERLKPEGGCFAGRIDNVGTVSGIRQEGEHVVYDVAVAGAVGLEAGDLVAVDGVALPVCRLTGLGFSARFHSRVRGTTNLASKRLGDAVNLEYVMPQ